MKKIKFIKFNFGFTLAEVLIVIGIIGIAAEITIPTLVKNFQKQTTLTQLKKEYSMLENMYIKAKMDSGTIDEWGFETNSNADTMINVYQNVFAPTFQVSKYCGGVDGSNYCWPLGTYRNGNSAPAYGGVSAILADGSSIMFEHSYYWTGTMGRHNVYINIDTNGIKNPNRWGKDRFKFFINNNEESNYRLVPDGTNLTYPWVQPARTACFTGTGESCSLTIITYDQWQILDE